MEPIFDRHAFMKIELRQESSAMLADYGRIPIAFEVNEVCDVSIVDGRLRLTPRRVQDSYVKDYDAISERPEDWRRFDTSNWAFFSAFADGELVGGAAVAWRTPQLHMLEGRDDLAVLWDIRVVPSKRQQGVGSALFGAATNWAASQGARQLKVETQNINAAACRFYARHGCVLLAAIPGAYAELPNEIQLLFYKDLDQE